MRIAQEGYDATLEYSHNYVRFSGHRDAAILYSSHAGWNHYESTCKIIRITLRHITQRSKYMHFSLPRDLADLVFCDTNAGNLITTLNGSW